MDFKMLKNAITILAMVAVVAVSATALPYDRPFQFDNSYPDQEVRDADGDLVFDDYSTTDIHTGSAYDSYIPRAQGSPRGGYGAFGASPITPFFPDKFSTNPPQTCAISTGHGLLNDVDCDRVPDIRDNCPQRPNPRQADQNRNGKGDACDITITDVNVQPKGLSCSRAFVAKARIVNNRGVPFNDVKAALNVKGLNVEVIDYIKVMQPGSATDVELTSRIPSSAEPGSYNLDFSIAYNVVGRPEKSAVRTAFNVDNDTCTQPSDDSFIDVKEIQDVKEGKTALWPIKITNTEDRANSYTFNVEGIEDFATYSISPGSLMIIEPGETRTVYLNLHADEEVREGEKTFVFEINKRDEAEQVTLVANVLPGKEDRAGVIPWIIGGLLLIGLFLGILRRLVRKTDSKRNVFQKLVSDTRGEKRSGSTQKHMKDFEGPKRNKDREKVAQTGINRERGWLYFLDGEGDVSRVRMKWAKQAET